MRERVAADAAESDLGQAEAADVGEDGQPVDLAGRPGHGGASEHRGTGPILTTPCAILEDTVGRTFAGYQTLACGTRWIHPARLRRIMNASATRPAFMAKTCV